MQMYYLKPKRWVNCILLIRLVTWDQVSLLSATSSARALQADLQTDRDEIQIESMQ